MRRERKKLERGSDKVQLSAYRLDLLSPKKELRCVQYQLIGKVASCTACRV